MTCKEIFEALAAPFPADQVRSRPGKFGKNMSYITARTARVRLNDVLGPENWECKIEPSERWVKCTLSITIREPTPEGLPHAVNVIRVTREALGGYPDMPSEEDKVKGGDSDAFKRACSLFGIGEYLYGDEAGHDDGHAKRMDYAPTRRDDAPTEDPPYRPKKEDVGGWFDKNKAPSHPAAPSRPDHEPTQRRMESGWPKDGAQCYAWVMKIKDHYGWPSILEEIKENFVNAAAYKYPFKFKEWDAHMVETVAQWVASQCATTETYKGEFDDHLGVAKSS